MSEILSSLHSPSWWFTVFFAALIVGVIASVIAAYTKTALDRAGLWLAAVRAEAIESTTKAVLDAQSDRLRLIEIYLRSVSYRQQSGRWLLFAFLMSVPIAVGFVTKDWLLAIFSSIATLPMLYTSLKWEALACKADAITETISKLESKKT